MASSRRRLLRLIDKAAGTAGSPSARTSVTERFAENHIGLAIDPMPRDTWRVRVGDARHGYTLERWCESRHEAADWLARIAESLRIA
jgi:hypothetical protein